MTSSPVNLNRIEQLVRELLAELGENPEREGLLRTPRRVAESMVYLTSDYRLDPNGMINNACFSQESDSMVIERDIELYSLCEHHMLPFYGRCHIG
ncbi:MAG: GTP cyclohydrolase I, partial [Candidatus Latescibacterota bacterium]